MARIEVWTKYKIPVGFYVHLNFAEACTVVHVGLPAIIGVLAAGAAAKPWMGVLATAILIQREWIRDKTEDSGGRGVRLRFNGGLGAIDGIRRKGRGPSPCTPPPEEPRADNSSVDASGLTVANMDAILENIQILQWARMNPITDPDPTPTMRRNFRREVPQARALRESALRGEVVRPPGPIGPIVRPPSE